MQVHPAIGLALVLSGQMLFTACTNQELAALVQSSGIAIATEDDQQTSKFAPDGGQQYGVEGSITSRQFAILQGLAWPQAYNDMRGTFGFPSHRTETADYYALDSDRSVWVVVFYSGTTATGYTTEAK